MSNLSAKKRIKKYNSDISEMIQKLNKFHEENIKFLNDFEGSQEIYAGNTHNLAEKLENTLFAAGLLKEEDFKYNQ
jgi:hypothetical protein